MAVSVVTALNPSPTYGQRYVDELRARLDAPLTVVHDTRWPGWWCKMAAFDPSAFEGSMLMMDLDTIPVGSVLPFIWSEPRCSMMLRDFYSPHRPASGVMLITEEDRAKVWEEWIKKPSDFMKRYRSLGDGGAIAEILGNVEFLQDNYPGLICSYKVDCQNGTPHGVSLICYHGRPRPHETGWDTGNAALHMEATKAPKPPAMALTLEQQRYAIHQNTRR